MVMIEGENCDGESSRTRNVRNCVILSSKRTVISLTRISTKSVTTSSEVKIQQTKHRMCISLSLKITPTGWG